MKTAFHGNVDAQTRPEKRANHLGILGRYWRILRLRDGLFDLLAGDYGGIMITLQYETAFWVLSAGDGGYCDSEAADLAFSAGVGGAVLLR